MDEMIAALNKAWAEWSAIAKAGGHAEYGISKNEAEVAVGVIDALLLVAIKIDGKS